MASASELPLTDPTLARELLRHGAHGDVAKRPKSPLITMGAILLHEVLAPVMENNCGGVTVFFRRAKVSQAAALVAPTRTHPFLLSSIPLYRRVQYSWRERPC